MRKIIALTIVSLLLGVSPAAQAQTTKPATTKAPRINVNARKGKKKARKFIRVPRARPRPAARAKKVQTPSSPQNQLQAWYKTCKKKNGWRKCWPKLREQMCRLSRNSKRWQKICSLWRARVQRAKKMVQKKLQRKLQRIKRRQQLSQRRRWRSCEREYRRLQRQGFGWELMSDACKCGQTYGGDCSKGYRCARVNLSGQKKWQNGICLPKTMKQKIKFFMVCSSQSNRLGCSGPGVVCDFKVDRSAICHVSSTAPSPKKWKKLRDRKDQLAIAFLQVAEKLEVEKRRSRLRLTKIRRLLTKMNNLKEQIKMFKNKWESAQRALASAQKKFNSLKIQFDRAIELGKTSDASTQEALRQLAQARKELRRAKKRVVSLRGLLRQSEGDKWKMRHRARRTGGWLKPSPTYPTMWDKNKKRFVSYPTTTVAAATWWAHAILARGELGSLCSTTGCTLIGGGGADILHQLYKFSKSARLYLNWGGRYLHVKDAYRNSKGIFGAHLGEIPLGLGIGSGLDTPNSLSGYLVSLSYLNGLGDMGSGFGYYPGIQLEASWKIQIGSFTLFMGAQVSFRYGLFSGGISLRLGPAFGWPSPIPKGQPIPNDPTR